MSIFERLREGVETSSPEETIKLGRQFAEQLPEEAFVALKGDLGVGKTTFVRGLARAWEIAGNITSPTYNIFLLHRGARNLIHLDAYRLDDAEQLDAIMLEDFLTPPFCLVVEWPEHVAEWLPPETYWLQLAILSPGRHQVILKQEGSANG